MVANRSWLPSAHRRDRPLRSSASTMSTSGCRQDISNIAIEAQGGRWQLERLTFDFRAYRTLCTQMAGSLPVGPASGA